MRRKKPKKPIPHGTPNGYGYYACRCPLCRKAHSERQIQGRERRYARLQAGLAPPDLVHGSTTYANWACRCEVCKREWQAYLKRRGPHLIDHATKAPISNYSYGCRCDGCTDAMRRRGWGRKTKARKAKAIDRAIKQVMIDEQIRRAVAKELGK